VSGAVVNSVTGEGIPRALVSLNQFVTLADGSGNFTFDGLPSGLYAISSQKPGYFAPGMRTGRPSFQTVQVGPNLSPVTMKLDPEAIVSGHVTDSDGLPVQHLPVKCLRASIMEGRPQWQRMNVVTTDEDGEYRLSGLMPGRYVIEAGPSRIPSIGAMTKTGKQFAGYGAAYYPAPADSSGHGGAPINAGQKIVADFSVDAQPFYRVAGALNVPSGFSVSMTLEPRDPADDAGGMQEQRDGNSFTVMMVPKGDYILRATAFAQNKGWFANLPLHVASDIGGLQVALQPGVSIPLNVSVQRTQASSAQPIAVGAGPRMSTPVQMMLSPVDATRSMRQRTMASPRPDDPSTFAFDNLPPGNYKAEFYSYGDLYVASARYGSTDLLRENLAVSQSSSDPIEIVLRDDGGKVKGSYAGDQEASQRFLLVLPDHGIPYQPRNLSSSADGFELRNLAPGSYSILAFDTLDDLEYSNPDSLEPYLSHAAHVDVTANQEASVTLELIRRGSER
jgi:hypothetical protein